MPKNNNIIIRVDGSHVLGLGHVMRCLALAHYLRQKRFKPVFICRDYDKNIFKLIRRNGYRVLPIKKNLSLGEDAQRTTLLTKSCGATVIVFDLSNANFTRDLNKYRLYLTNIGQAGLYLAVIGGINENLGRISPFIAANMVIIPYYGVPGSVQKKYERNKLLAGPRYVIFRPEFIKARNNDKKSKKIITLILVTMGGSDPLNLTLKVAAALRSIAEREISVRIILGASFAKGIGRKIAARLRSFAGKYQIVAGDGKVAKQMSWADLVVTTGGLSKYEAAVMGRPAVLISQNLDEARSTCVFHDAGLAVHLGCGRKVMVKMIAQAISKMIGDPAAARAMAARGRGIFDAQGAKRITEALAKELRK